MQLCSYQIHMLTLNVMASGGRLGTDKVMMVESPHVELLLQKKYALLSMFMTQRKQGTTPFKPTLQHGNTFKTLQPGNNSH